MTDTHADPGLRHPAPARHRIPAWRLAYGLAAAPAAWLLQLEAGSAVGGLACLSEAGARMVTGSPMSGMAIVAINAVAILIAGLAILVSWAGLRHTRQEGRDRNEPLAKNEGRTRFLCVAGIWISTLFTVATLVSTISILGRGGCPS